MSSDRARGGSSFRDVREALALFVPVALLGFLALNGGGYELPLRQQVWLAIWWALAVGFAFGALPRSMPPRGWRLAVGGMLALGALQLLSVAWGPSDDTALADASRSFGYLVLLGLAWTCLGPRSWAWAATGLFGVASVVTAHALVGRLVPDLTGLDDPFGAGRLAEPLGYWNALAFWAAMTLAMAVAWSADARHIRVRGIAAAMIPVAATVVYLTYSRGGVVAGAAGVLIVVALSPNRSRAALHAAAGAVATAFCVFAIRSQPQIADGSGGEGAFTVGICILLAGAACWLFASSTARFTRRRKAGAARSPMLPLAGAAALAAALIVVALVAGRDGFGRGGDAALLDDDPSARLTSAAGNRSAFWSEAIDGFTSQPLRGEGAGSFGYRWAAEGSDPELVNDPHSLPFAVASELGILGLGALAALVAGIVAALVRGYAVARGAAATGLAAGVGVFGVSLAIDWTWESTALATLGLGCAGVLAMAAAKPVRGRHAGQPPAKLWRWAGFALALALGAIQVPGVVATTLVRESEEQRRYGNPEGAIREADEALNAAPWSAAAYAALAEAKLDTGDSTGARLDALEAIEREPREARHRILLARIEFERDDLHAVADALAEAVALSPNEPRLGSREVAQMGARLERHGFDRAAIRGVPRE